MEWGFELGFPNLRLDALTTGPHSSLAVLLPESYCGADEMDT